jgi:hypothetical protein
MNFWIFGISCRRTHPTRQWFIGNSKRYTTIPNKPEFIYGKLQENFLESEGVRQ